MGKGKKGLGRDGREGEIEERWDEEMKKRRAQQRSRRHSFRIR